MIIVQLLGGFGNQLFQYAAGLCLAEKKQVPLKVDVSEYNVDQLRNFELHALQVPLEIATPQELAPYSKPNFIQRLWGKLVPRSNAGIFKERHFHFDPQFFVVPMPVYLRGYWQSEKYFEAIQDRIRRDFVFRPEVIQKVTNVAEEIRKENSVSVHIRRGDYTNPKVQKTIGPIPIDHYQKAIQRIQEKVQQPRFYFFSDDIPWVQENLKIPGAIYASKNLSHNHFEDMYLMSQCRHNIIANSSSDVLCG